MADHGNDVAAHQAGLGQETSHRAGSPDNAIQPVLLLERLLLAANPAKALELLSNLAPNDRYKQVIKLSQRSVNDPRQLLEVYQAVPMDPTMGPLQERFEVWNKVGNNAYDRYGDDYVTWVEKMPEGRDRDMALSALAIRIDRKYPEEAARLRSLKTVPANAK